MQVCYFDLNPPVKNIKEEIEHPENMERVREMYCQRKLLFSCNTTANALLQEIVKKKHVVFHTRKGHTTR